MALVIFIAAFVGLAVLVVVGIRKGGQIEAARDAKFQEAAKRLGWQFILKPMEGHREAGVPEQILRASWDEIEFSVEGQQQGHPWRMWYDRAHRFSGQHLPGDSEVSPSDAFAVFGCEAVRAAELSVLILPRWQYKLEASRAAGIIGAVAQALSTGASQAKNAPSRRDFVLGAVEVSTSPALHDAYALLAGRNVPRDWFDPELESLLLNLPKPVQLSHRTLVVRLDNKGLRMDFLSPPVDSWAFWQAFARLGEGLMARWIKAGIARR